MVTTFSPPARPKVAKKKLPIPLIALGAVAGILLIVVFILLNKSNAESARANQLSEAAVKIAASLGATNITPEVLSDSTVSQEALDSLAVAVTDQSEGLKAAQAEIETARANAAKVQGELTAATESAADAQSKLDSLSRDLSTRGTELQTLQKKYDADVEALTKEIAELKSAQAVASTEVVTDETTNGEEAAADEPVAVAAGDKTVTLPKGASHYFSSYTYDAASSKLTLQAIKGGKLTFSDVPEEVVSEMETASVFDVYFRFKLMDKYPSNPKDREFMRDLK